ncbi:MAG: YncE family protein [Proteobacteria bacterium]|nr:YncE family protein [Pseudomonadota bacterium]
MLRVFALSLCLFSSAALAGPSGYHLEKTVPLAGDGFWDYLGFDTANRHLFVTHGTHVIVLNADTQAIAGDIPDTARVHGVAVADDLGRGFTSNGGDNTVTAFDLKTLKTIARYPTGTGPDSIAYDPVTHRVFTFDGKSNDATALDGTTGAVAGTVPLGGRPETAVADGLGNVFANVESTSEIVKIDAHALKVTARWKVAPCESPSGLAMDTAHGILFTGCDNKMMAVIDASNGKVLATPAIGDGVDADRFDPDTGYAFASTGGGMLTVVHEDSSRKFSIVENVPTQKGARTMEIDPRTHTVFLVTADRTPTPPTPDNPHPRPTIAPGTFRLLVYAR